MDDADTTSPEPDPRFRCFERPDEAAAVEMSVAKLLGKLQMQSQAMFVDEENILRMNHGAGWIHSAREEDPDTTMHHISAEWVIPFKDLADNDLGLIARSILPISEGMQRQFAENMYGVVGAAAEKVGNVVDARAAGSFPQSMLEMMKKIELGVDRDGNVSMPQTHVSAETFERMKSEFENVSPELEAEFERVKAEKVQAALHKEAERKARFKTAKP